MKNDKLLYSLFILRSSGKIPALTSLTTGLAIGVALPMPSSSSPISGEVFSVSSKLLS